MIRWRQLLDAVGVRWIDRGHNTARGQVNCKCPWCGPTDPSEHLGINEADGAYYCLRSNGKHAGRSTPYLLMALGVPPYQIDALIREFSDDRPADLRPVRRQEPGLWEKFASAANYPQALQYLKSRSIDPPAVMAKKYDMRFTIVGRYAWRILLPLHLNREIVGFTGRAINNRIAPRYLTNDSGGASLYIPAYPTEATQTVQIVEGPLDARAITEAFPRHEIVAVAILGLTMGPERLAHLVDVIDGRPVRLTLDDDQHRSTVADIKERLRQMLFVAGHKKSVVPYPLPSSRDADEMTPAEIRRWLLT